MNASYKTDTVAEIDPWALTKAAGLASTERRRCDLASGSFLIAIVDIRARDAAAWLQSVRHPITGERPDPADVRAHGLFVPLVASREFVARHSPEFAAALSIPPPPGECYVCAVLSHRDILVTAPLS